MEVGKGETALIVYKDLAFSIVRYRLPHGLPKTYWYCSTGEVQYFSSLHCTAGVQCHHLHVNVSFKLIFKILYEDAAEASDPGEDQGGADSKMFITESRWPEENRL